MILIENR